MGASTRTDAVAPPVVDPSMLVDSLDDAVVAVDTGQRIVAWNPAAERLFGYPADAAIGESRSLVEPVDDPKGWPAGVLNGRPARFRATRVDRLGRPLALEVTASPIVDAAGRVAGIVQLLRPVPDQARRPLIELAEDMARIGHWRIEVAGDRHTWSDEVYRIHGFEPGAPPLDSEQALALYHPDDRAGVAQAIGGAIRKGGDIAFEGRVVRPSGEIRRVIGRGTTERGADGRATAVVGVLQDVTDRKAIETELAGTSAVLQATLDTMPNALVAFDGDNRLVAWNRAFAELVGVGPDRLARGRARLGVLRDALRRAPSTSVSFKGMVRRIIQRNAADLEWQREDGEIYAVLGRPMANGGYLTLFRNVTAERSAQARAAEFEQRLSDALEAMSEGFALFDADDVLVLCNETYRTIYGESSTFIRPGRRFEDIVRDGVAAGQFPGAIGREEQWIAERLRIHRNPPEQPALQTLADGRVLTVAEYRTKEGGYVGIRADITERIRAEHDLRTARDALEEQAGSLRDLAGQIDAARRRAEDAGAAKSRFLAMMSHELRTPMTGLLGMIELTSRTGLDGEQRTFVDTMRDSAETLLALLNDILDYSKLEAGKVQLEEIVFEPAQVVKDVVGLFQAQASAKGLVLAAELQPSVPSWVRGDPLRVKQILSNLISNAIKFTAAGGIGVELGATEGPGGTVRLQGQVADTGQGIDPDVQHNLFQAFEQGDTSTTRRFGGTGLGLAISRRLVEGMGGQITVDSEPGKGSTFRFTVLVRVAAVPPRVEHELAGIDDGPVPPLRILLAEDNDVNRMLVSKVLAQSGHRVDEVVDGREALRAAVRVDYDVILMDMQMPVMDGMEATRAIRTLPGEAAEVPVIALTADAMPEHRQMYLDAGVDALLTKPVDWRLLSRTLARTVRGERTAGAAAPHPAPVSPPAESTMDSLPVFDRARVEEGLGVLPPHRVAGMLSMLPAEVRRRLDEYRTALEAEDLAAARRAAHTLKGLAANFGAARLEAMSRATEAACGSIGAARAAAPLIHEAVERTAVAAVELSASFEARVPPKAADREQDQA